MILIGNIENFSEEKFYSLEIKGNRLLLIRHNKSYHLILDKCGHFGVSMARGDIVDNAIRCPVHGISFDLNTGEKVNRPWEICDSITIIPIEIKEKEIYCDLKVLEL